MFITKKKHNKLINEKDNSILDLEARFKLLNDRVKEIENTYERDSGIKIRTEVTKVFSKFDKPEMIVMMAGVSSLLKNPGSHNDAEYYVNLIKKIQGYIDHMEED